MEQIVMRSKPSTVTASQHAIHQHQNYTGPQDRFHGACSSIKCQRTPDLPWPSSTNKPNGFPGLTGLTRFLQFYLKIVQNMNNLKFFPHYSPQNFRESTIISTLNHKKRNHRPLWPMASIATVFANHVFSTPQPTNKQTFRHKAYSNWERHKIWNTRKHGKCLE